MSDEKRDKIMRLVQAEREYIAAFKDLRGHLPLILHSEVYQYFGQPCQIIEANVFNEVEDCEVVVEGPFGERQGEIEFSQLEFRDR
jgi:hypothetical protein